MSKFFNNLFTAANAVVSATQPILLTVSVKEYMSFTVSIQNNGSAALAVQFFSLSHDISAALSRALFTNTASQIAASGVEMYQMSNHAFDQLVIKGSATATIAAANINISFNGRNG